MVATTISPSATDVASPCKAGGCGFCDEHHEQNVGDTQTAGFPLSHDADEHQQGKEGDGAPHDAVDYWCGGHEDRLPRRHFNGLSMAKWN
jgi:hypothetical protein